MIYSARLKDLPQDAQSVLSTADLMVSSTVTMMGTTSVDQMAHLMAPQNEAGQLGILLVDPSVVSSDLCWADLKDISMAHLLDIQLAATMATTMEPPKACLLACKSVRDLAGS